jgi:hypothetical protein
MYFDANNVQNSCGNQPLRVGLNDSISGLHSPGGITVIMHVYFCKWIPYLILESSTRRAYSKIHEKEGVTARFKILTQQLFMRDGNSSIPDGKVSVNRISKCFNYMPDSTWTVKMFLPSSWRYTGEVFAVFFSSSSCFFHCLTENILTADLSLPLLPSRGNIREIGNRYSFPVLSDQTYVRILWAIKLLYKKKQEK